MFSSTPVVAIPRTTFYKIETTEDLQFIYDALKAKNDANPYYPPYPGLELLATEVRYDNHYMPDGKTHMRLGMWVQAGYVRSDTDPSHVEFVVEGGALSDAVFAEDYLVLSE